VPILALELVVVTVSVAVALVEVELRETDDGLSEQPIFAVEDETLHDKLTVPLNPLVALTVIVDVPDCPAKTVTLAGFAEIE
jgi:hypothetical protein